MIEAETLPAVYARHRVMAEATRAAAPALGLRLLAPDNPAPGVTGILTPEGLDGGKLVKYMRDDLGVTIQGGQDQMKGKLARFGHMGYLSPFDMIVAITAFELALKRGGYSVKLGAGVTAVEERIARGD
jgi:aspartate aminotransferase-like enzyme